MWMLRPGGRSGLEPVLWLLCREASSTSLGNACALQFRAEAVVPARMAEMIRCIKERDFQGFGQLTMKDSNQFHATCLDTYPPISYLNDISRRIIHLVHCFNTYHGQTKARWGRGSTANLRRGPQATSFSKTMLYPSAHLSVTKLHRTGALCSCVQGADSFRLTLVHFGCVTH